MHPLAVADEFLRRNPDGAAEAAHDKTGEDGDLEGRDVSKELPAGDQVVDEQYEEPGDDARRGAKVRNAKMSGSQTLPSRVESPLVPAAHAVESTNGGSAQVAPAGPK